MNRTAETIEQDIAVVQSKIAYYRVVRDRYQRSWFRWAYQVELRNVNEQLANANSVLDMLMAELQEVRCGKSVS